MIIAIEGEVLKKEPTSVDIKLNSGLVYRVNISLYTSSDITTKEVFLYTSYIVKEDSQKLYGFSTIEEKEIFDRVLKINGVGPSTALAICSTLNPDEFIQALSSSNIEAFKKVPGIGPKSAKRILVELGDFIPSSKSGDIKENISIQKAKMALESLGFKKEAIKKVLYKCNSSTTEELIKEALKQLR